jgi:cephalosporin-C deacetylase-like acetyl esterase
MSLEMPLCPSDFDRFWQKTLQELSAVDADICCGKEKDINDDLSLYQLSFFSLNNKLIKGYALLWNDVARPLVIHTHGYNSNIGIKTEWAETGLNVIGFDTRGFGCSTEGVSVNEKGYILTEIECAEKSILRGAVCDFVQAARVGKRLLNQPPSRTVFYGFSFAGAMAIQAASISEEADIVVAGAATFAWHAMRRQLKIKGSGKEVIDFLNQSPFMESKVMNTLNYFDTLHFVERLKCPVLMGVGLRDDVVPAKTVFALIDLVRAPMVVREFSESHGLNDDLIWKPFNDEFLAYALEGPNGMFFEQDRCLNYS